jgi:hypothetical protein
MARDMRSLPAIAVMLAVGYSTAALACKDLMRPEHLVASWVDARSGSSR